MPPRPDAGPEAAALDDGSTGPPARDGTRRPVDRVADRVAGGVAVAPPSRDGVCSDVGAGRLGATVPPPVPEAEADRFVDDDAGARREVEFELVDDPDVDEVGFATDPAVDALIVVLVTTDFLRAAALRANALRVAARC